MGLNCGTLNWEFTLKSLRERILEMFAKMNAPRLDLHVLFEAAGNDPAEREQVLDQIEELVRDGYFETGSSDFYSLTEKGKRASAAS